GVWRSGGDRGEVWRLNNVEFSLIDWVAEVLWHEMLHHFRNDLVAEPCLYHTNWSLAGSETGHACTTCKFLGDVRDFSINDIFWNLDLEVFLALAEVYEFCLHWVGRPNIFPSECERGDSNPHGVSH